MAQERRRLDDRVIERLDAIESKVDCLATTYARYEPYLKEAVKRERYWDGVKDENIKNVVKGAVWATFLAICTALWLLVKHSLGINK